MGSGLRFGRGGRGGGGGAGLSGGGGAGLIQEMAGLDPDGRLSASTVVVTVMSIAWTFVRGLSASAAHLLFVLLLFLRAGVPGEI